MRALFSCGYLFFHYGLVFISLIKKVPKSFSLVLLTLGIVNIGFIGFTIFTSNPFLRAFRSQRKLRLNPVLQDPG